jgi:hypothetical protein
METLLAKGRNVKIRKARRPRLLRQSLDQSDPSVTREEALAATAEAVASADFPASARNRRFLEYVVRHTLDGNPDKISGYLVATEVFGREPDFNPTTDPIVRIEAAKLRRDLEVYYLKSGSRTPVRITLPRGGYVPVFHRPAPTERSAFLDPQAITVHDLKEAGMARSGPPLRARVIDHLARQAEVSVFAGPPSASADGLLDSETARELGRRNGTRFIMSGDAHPGSDGEVVCTARLHDGQTGRLLWSADIAGGADVLPEALVARTLSARREWAAKLDGTPDLSV